MGIDDLKSEILQAADKERTALLEKAKADAKSIVDEASAQAKQEAKLAKEETQKTIEAMEARELSSAKFDARKALFEKQQEIVDSVFDEVGKKLESMKPAERAKIVNSLLKMAKAQAPIHYVIGNKKDKDTISKQYSFQEGDLLGGIIAETKDRSIRIDLSYEQLLSEIKSTKLQEIAKTLF